MKTVTTKETQFVSQHLKEQTKKAFDIPVLQEHYRVTEIDSQILARDMFLNVATFQANETSLKVSWVSVSNCSHYLNQIVRPDFSGAGISKIGSLPAKEVTLLTKPASIKIFDTIPVAWVKDRSLVKRAGALFEQLPIAYKMLFNAIFWDADRFYRFCICPSSLHGHHSHLNGNLRHTVEVCENLLTLTNVNKHANLSLTLFSGLIHDAGKADEYVSQKYGWQLSDIGKLHGHKVTVFKWVIEAITRHSIQLPEGHYDAIIHVLTAQPNAPEWMGIRPPALTESFLLSAADRFSGHVDLMNQTLPSEAGQGQYHKHLKNTYFKIGN